MWALVCLGTSFVVAAWPQCAVRGQWGGGEHIQARSNQPQSHASDGCFQPIDAMSTKLTPEEVVAAGLDEEEAKELDAYLSDTEPDLGQDTGPSKVRGSVWRPAAA